MLCTNTENSAVWLDVKLNYRIWMQVSEVIIQYLHNYVDMSTSEKSYLHIVIVVYLYFV